MAIQERRVISEIPLATATTDPGRNGTARTLIEPAATFTNVTPSSADGGNKTTLTSAGAHGLTAAVAVTPGNVNIYISAGTGWTPGFYPISSIDLDTTGVAITINTPFSAGFGTPTIALANTEVTFFIIAIPPLGPNSFIKCDTTWSVTNSGNQKIPIIRFNNTVHYGPVVTTSNVVRPAPIIIQNRNSISSQVGSHSNANNAASGVTAGGATVSTGSVDTSVPTVLTFGGRPTTANEIITVERYLVEVFK